MSLNRIIYHLSLNELHLLAAKLFFTFYYPQALLCYYRNSYICKLMQCILSQQAILES